LFFDHTDPSNFSPKDRTLDRDAPRWPDVAG